MSPEPEPEPEYEAAKSEDNILVFEEKRLVILKKVHDQPAIGHPGVKKTLELIKRFFYWPKIRAAVDQYVRNCHTCRRANSPRDGYAGLLQPLQIPERPWTDISLNLVTGLPSGKGFKAIRMVVDRFSKMHHYIPCMAKDEGMTTEEMAK